MDTVKFNKMNTLVVAHRGLSGIEKENTNSAFVAAGNRSYFGIETDVHKTLDGKYVVFHDDTTGRVAIDDMEVEKTTFDCLRSLILTDVDGKKGRSDIRIPTLAEYISICKKYEKTAVLELKNAFAEKEIYEIVNIIEDLGYLDHVIFISFCLENLVMLRAKYPEQPAQFLIDDYQDSLIDILKKNNLDLDIEYTALNDENMNALHNAGIKVNCWTCNDPEAGERLAQWGIDYITSNILE
ncbi:MAG: hypothetical protein LUH40_08275 [Clostridiales bacterium]|nr:hypothetical protein [Clostridiales bacterium]